MNTIYREPRNETRDELHDVPQGQSQDSTQLLNIMWAAPPVSLVWRGYREELEKAGVNVPVHRDSEFAWIYIQWRQPRENKTLPFEHHRFNGLINSLGRQLVDKGALQATHLLAHFPPVNEIKVIDNRWLAWLLIAKSSGHLWSIRCTVNIERLQHFVPGDIAEGIAGLCWHCAFYIRRDRLELLSREIFQWEKTHESEIAGL